MKENGTNNAPIAAFDHMIESELYEYSCDIYRDKKYYTSIQAMDGPVDYKGRVFIVSHEEYKQHGLNLDVATVHRIEGDAWDDTPSMEEKNERVAQREKMREERLAQMRKAHEESKKTYEEEASTYNYPELEDPLKLEQRGDFHIGKMCDDHTCETYICKKCGADKFQVGHSYVFTALKCTNCGWEKCIHEG